MSDSDDWSMAPYTDGGQLVTKWLREVGLNVIHEPTFILAGNPERRMERQNRG